MQRTSAQNHIRQPGAAYTFTILVTFTDGTPGVRWGDSDTNGSAGKELATWTRSSNNNNGKINDEQRQPRGEPSFPHLILRASQTCQQVGRIYLHNPDKDIRRRMRRRRRRRRRRAKPTASRESFFFFNQSQDKQNI